MNFIGKIKKVMYTVSLTSINLKITLIILIDNGDLICIELYLMVFQ